MTIDLGKLTEQQTYDLVVEALQNLDSHRILAALKAALTEDDIAELAAALE